MIRLLPNDNPKPLTQYDPDYHQNLNSFSRGLYAKIPRNFVISG